MNRVGMWSGGNNPFNLNPTYTPGSADSNIYTTPMTNTAAVGIGDAAAATVNPGSTVADEDVSSSAALERYIAAAVVTINTVAAIRLAELEDEVAGMYATMSDEARAYYNDYYAPCEDKLIAATCAAEKYKREFDSVSIGRAMITARAALKNSAHDRARCVGRYCTGLLAATLKDAAIAEAGAVANARAAGLHYEEDRETARNIVRWNRRAEVLKLGRGMNTDAVSYGETAAKLYGGLMASVSAGITGGKTYLGFGNPRDIQGPAPRPKLELAPASIIPTPPPTQNVVVVNSTGASQDVPQVGKLNG